MITIVRNTFPAVRGTVMRDFLTILKDHDLYREEYHSKTAHEYNINSNIVEFISLDQPQKIRGRKRDVLFVNECNEISYEGWQQLIFRTTERIIIDYNPSDEYHWIYDKVLTRDDCAFYQTTYLDNPFLGQVNIAEIERLKDLDENDWKVYGLGERGISRSTILTHWKEVNQVPLGWRLMNLGMDFGYVNDPTTIVAVYTDGEGFCVDELCYSTGLTNLAIAQVLRDNKVARTTPIIADCAEPKSIVEICDQGFNVHSCRKGADSIRNGLDYLRSHPLSITSRSINGIKELRNYKYIVDRNGNTLNQPIDRWNHFIDAMRYAITFNQLNKNYGTYAVG